MKKTITLLSSVALGLALNAQIIGKKSNLTNAINAAGNPALVHPYSIPSIMEDSLLEGYPLVHKKAINTGTFMLEYSGYDKYPKDANGNYTSVFWGNINSGKLDTTILHTLNYTYSGTNPTNYVIKTWNSNNYNGIRHASATYNAGNVTRVTSLDTAFSSGTAVASSAVDSFNYDGSGNLISRYMTVDNGKNKIVQEKDVYTISGGKVKLHVHEEWNKQTNQYDIEQVSLFYNGNNLLDSANYGDDLYRFAYDANGKITSTMLLEDNGSGSFDMEEKAEVAYNSSGKIESITYYEYQSGMWEEAAKRTTTYDSDTLVKVTETRKFGPQTITFGEWIYGDTGSTAGPTPPAAPTTLAAVIGSRAASTKAVDLTWLDNSTDETGIVLERASTGAFAVHATLAADVTTYKDTTNLEEGTTYKYRVYATNAAGNSANSNEISVDVPANDSSNTGIASGTETNSIHLYPNPANSSLSINSAKNGMLSIMGMTGTVVYKNEVTNNEFTLNTSEFESGLYLVSVQFESGVEIQRLVVEH